ncbi:5'-nucleotidase C-terminal domain-containing protein [bacterium]|nr:5'-nucleotidase C-terminal domain-containing protein [bacterium]
MNISKVSMSAMPVSDETKASKTVQDNNQGVQQFSSDASSASMAYGLSMIKKPVNAAPVESIQEKPAEQNNSTKTLNIFYFSDTHGELTGLTKLGAAKEACEQSCGGADKLTVLGSGDLIAGSQTPVINATVGVVNKLGMEATSLGNHERSRSNAKLTQLNEDMKPDILAINATEKDKECSIIPSKVIKQGDIEFITVGAQPLSPIEDPKDISKAIDEEVARIKQERKEQGLNDNLPVIFLSHMGSDADKIAAENSETIDVILGGHSHNVEEFNYTGKSGKNILVLQGGKNNEYATVVKMDIAEDGTVSSSAKKIHLKSDVESICNEVQGFYGTSETSPQTVEAAKIAEEEIAETVAESVGPKVDLAFVPEGYGYNVYTDGAEKDRERNYCNPVSNIMADAMLAKTADRGVQVAFFNAPSVKDTEIESNANLSNYDIMGRMIPFGGEIVTTELPISKFYELIESEAQSIINSESQLMQVGGMTYSVNADKAQARYNANIGIMKAEDDLKKAAASGGDIGSAQKALDEARAFYDSLPGCVEKILILNSDGSELKINPKAIERGDFDGQTIKCATNDFLAHMTRIDENTDYKTENTGIELTKAFADEISKIKDENDGVMFVDQNDVRISVKDKNGIINGYEVPTGLNTKYWY